MFKRWLNRLLPKKKIYYRHVFLKKIIAIWLQRIFKILFLLYTKWTICQREKKIRSITLKMIHYWNNLFVNQLFYHISTYEINYQKKERYSSQGGEEKWKEEQYGSKHKFKETWRSNRPPFCLDYKSGLALEFPANRTSSKIDLRNYNRLSELYNRTYVIVASSPSAITGHRSAKLAIKPYL